MLIFYKFLVPALFYCDCCCSISRSLEITVPAHETSRAQAYLCLAPLPSRSPSPQLSHSLTLTSLADNGLTRAQLSIFFKHDVDGKALHDASVISKSLLSNFRPLTPYTQKITCLLGMSGTGKPTLFKWSNPLPEPEVRRTILERWTLGWKVVLLSHLTEAERRGQSRIEGVDRVPIWGYLKS